MAKKKETDTTETLKKFKVFGTVMISVTYTVEAKDAEDALEVASLNYPGLNDYCGNGRRSGALIGTNDRDLEIEAGEDCPKWAEAESLD